MKDFIILAGAPGSGKTTIAKLLAKELNSFVFDFGILREVHLKTDWSNQSEEEEQMSFENLISILKNYKKYGYKNVILTDLRDFRVEQLPDTLGDFDYVIFSLIVNNEEELRKRVRGERESGYKDVEKALEWNLRLSKRKTVKNEQRVNNDSDSPQDTANYLLDLL